MQVVSSSFQQPRALVQNLVEEIRNFQLASGNSELMATSKKQYLFFLHFK